MPYIALPPSATPDISANTMNWLPDRPLPTDNDQRPPPTAGPAPRTKDASVWPTPLIVPICSRGAATLSMTMLLVKAKVADTLRAQVINTRQTYASVGALRAMMVQKGYSHARNARASKPSRRALQAKDRALMQQVDER